MRCNGPLAVRDDEEPDVTWLDYSYSTGCGYCGQDHEKMECPVRPLSDWMPLDRKKS